MYISPFCAAGDVYGNCTQPVHACWFETLDLLAGIHWVQYHRPAHIYPLAIGRAFRQGDSCGNHLDKSTADGYRVSVESVIVSVQLSALYGAISDCRSNAAVLVTGLEY